MDISKLNQIALLEDSLPTKPLSALNINETYKVTDLKQVKTKFGQKVQWQLPSFPAKWKHKEKWSSRSWVAESRRIKLNSSLAINISLHNYVYIYLYQINDLYIMLTYCLFFFTNHTYQSNYCVKYRTLTTWRKLDRLVSWALSLQDRFLVSRSSSS